MANCCSGRQANSLTAASPAKKQQRPAAGKRDAKENFHRPPGRSAHVLPDCRARASGGDAVSDLSALVVAYGSAMTFAALIVAVIAAVIALASAAYARTQAVAAKGSLKLEQARRKDEMAPRLEAKFVSDYSGGLELELRLLPGQPPLGGVQAQIVEGTGVAFDTSPRAPGGCGASHRHEAASEGILAPGSTVRWPVTLRRPSSDQIVLEICDRACEGRVSGITVDVPPDPTVW